MLSSRPIDLSSEGTKHPVKGALLRTLLDGIRTKEARRKFWNESSVSAQDLRGEQPTEDTICLLNVLLPSKGIRKPILRSMWQIIYSTMQFGMERSFGLIGVKSAERNANRKATMKITPNRMKLIGFAPNAIG